MIKIIAGEKGTGKTARLVDDINTVAASDNNVVCLQRGNRLNELIKPNVRLVNMEEYPVAGLDQIAAFIAGIASKDYDLTHIYIDSIRKVANIETIDGIEAFIEKLDKFFADKNVTVTIIISEKTIPESLKTYC